MIFFVEIFDFPIILVAFSAVSASWICNYLPDPDSQNSADSADQDPQYFDPDSFGSVS